ncbi:hypothetical protein P3G55_02285 [Leptospira sp. 96542]|nr:hypothetical protein [Leptospira sp. 96542]
MRTYFLYFVYFLTPFVLQASTEKEFLTEALDTVAEFMFSSPSAKEEKEIRKRIREKNQSEIRMMRIQLKNLIQTHSIQNLDFETQTKKAEEFESQLAGFPNLGGILWKEKGDTIFQYGDWSDFYEDGFSREKIRLEGQIPSFRDQTKEIYFFIRNETGYAPSEFSFLGWESRFYTFGDDGSLRYTNDFSLDPSIRLADFRKAFDSIRKKIPGSKIAESGDLHTFIVPGKAKPIHSLFLILRLVLVVWTIWLLYSIVQTSFLSKKNQLPENLAPIS